MRQIDEFSKVVGAMSCFNEMIATGCKNVALGHPTSDRALRDEHMEHALRICQEKGTQCCEENGGFLTDLFPAAMNRDKFNILFYKDTQYRDAYFAMKERKNRLVALGSYRGEERRRLAVDFGKLLSYTDQEIQRMMAENTDLEEIPDALETTLDVHGKIEFLYFDDLPKAFSFFEETMKFPLACDQGWCRIYRVCSGAYIGAVDRSRGACKATTRDGVLTSLVVLNFEEMVERLKAIGIQFEHPPHYSEALEIKSMMFVGPEGYKFEVEEFLNPQTRQIFYPNLG